MKTVIQALSMAAALLCATPLLVEGATTATANINFTIGSINEIAVSGSPGTFTINSASPGSQPASVQDTSTNYSVTTNNTAQKITGALDSAMPTGVTLSVNLPAPTGGTSAGTVALTASSQNLVTGISQVAQSGLTITYTFAASAAAAQGSGSRVLTYTIGP